MYKIYDKEAKEFVTRPVKTIKEVKKIISESLKDSYKQYKQEECDPKTKSCFYNTVLEDLEVVKYDSDLQPIWTKGVYYNVNNQVVLDKKKQFIR